MSDLKKTAALSFLNPMETVYEANGMGDGALSPAAKKTPEDS